MLPRGMVLPCCDNAILHAIRDTKDVMLPCCDNAILRAIRDTKDVMLPCCYNAILRAIRDTKAVKDAPNRKTFLSAKGGMLCGTLSAVHAVCLAGGMLCA